VYHLRVIPTEREGAHAYEPNTRGQTAAFLTKTFGLQ